MSGGISVTTIASYAAIAGAAVSTFSALSSGKQQSDAANAQADRDRAMADYQQKQADADASVQASEAQLQARQIRLAGDRQRSTARANIAASGMDLGVGTSEIIDKTINKNSEQDALTAIYDGNTKADQIRQTGKIAQYQGQSDANALNTKAGNLTTASYLNAGASALSAVGTASKAWGSGYAPSGK